MNTQPPFTPDETFVVNHYRNPANASWSRNIGLEAACLSVSFFFAALHLTKDDPTWGAIAYIILVYFVVRQVLNARRWRPAIYSVFEKYEARIAELSSALERKEETDPPA